MEKKSLCFSLYGGYRSIHHLHRDLYAVLIAQLRPLLSDPNDNRVLCMLFVLFTQTCFSWHMSASTNAFSDDARIANTVAMKMDDRAIKLALPIKSGRRVPARGKLISTWQELATTCGGRATSTRSSSRAAAALSIDHLKFPRIKTNRQQHALMASGRSVVDSSKL